MHRLTSIFAATLTMLAIAGCGAADSTAAAGCKTYVQEIRSACMDMILRGLDISCNQHIIAIETAMKQADGSLFDAGDNQTNQSVADTLCSSRLGNLREARAEKDEAMAPADAAGPQCTALAARFETRCLTTLGKKPLSSACRGVARSFAIGGVSQVPREKICALAAMQLPEP